MNDQTPWYKLDNPETLDSPALLIYQECVLQNIDTLIKMIDDVNRLRPHVKTHKSSNISKLLIAAGIKKFKCATIAELEMLASCGAEDVLLAYQPMGPKQHRLLSLRRKYPETKMACLIDDITIARGLSSRIGIDDQPVEIYFDVNVGMNRTGIAISKVPHLYQACQNLKGLKIAGLHVYDGHFRDPNFTERKSQCDAAFKLVEDLLQSLDHKGDPLKIIAGGSPTFPIHAQRIDVECSPGTFIYWDMGYSKKCAEQDFVPAALVLSRIISLPDATKLCLDLGHKSIASENPLDRRVHFLNAPDLQFIGHSEEHLVVDAGKNHHWQVGDLLYGLPMHICPTVALYNETQLIENRKATETWQTTARGRRLSL